MREDYRDAFVVDEAELGPDARLSLRALCLRLQEAAGADAARLGFGVADLARHGLAWMLVGLRVACRAGPRAGERLAIRSWPRSFGRLIAERDFELHGADGAPAALATSRWVVADLVQRRAVRLPDFVRRVPTPARDPLLPANPERLRAPEACEIERRFEVRPGDLDGAGHLNNTVYVGWTERSVPDDLAGSARATGLEIEFAREAVAGDGVTVCTARDAGEPGLYRHELRRDDGARLAVACTRWEPRPW